ncbi:hypothetical protein [Frateuria sp. STR12]|uniref:hypothetical protein n=1 Tax=Frateuria hangzhouensis TaxID=2995589 RepID=UPI002260DA5F|nr:hypothetical protein [Frateuria sp. STR12]MCX7514895.1 hypothetical protein [Frateuria sp. STR12]
MKSGSAIHPSVRSGSTAIGAARRSLPGIGILLLAALVGGCATSARHEIEADRIQAHQAPLELRASQGLPPASIATDGSVTIGDETLPIDRSQKAATLAYRHAALDVVDHSLRDASRLVKFAIPRVLFGLVMHGADHAGDAVEADANAIPHSPEFCALLQTMLDTQVTMVDSVQALRPYASLEAGDIDDCRAGRPYSQPL